MRIAIGALVAMALACGRVPAPSLTTWGIEPVSLRATLGGTMLDFRFKVVDAGKARRLFDRKLKPYLFDPSSGVALGMPEDGKLGALRASLRNPPLAGKQYYVLFANGYGTVKRGRAVTVVIGDCKLEHVRVD
ncbi:MAG: hypothetical protein JWM53_542 [bacterium]|nr:hypothetical protein [bacterium]